MIHLTNVRGTILIYGGDDDKCCRMTMEELVWVLAKTFDLVVKNVEERSPLNFTLII